MNVSFWTELREKLTADPQRPRYHFLPPANWMNDPNGPLFWKGKYHIFYQHNPYAAFHGGITGTMHWGHAFSEDLVHWNHLPIALAPTPGGPDKNGIYTGCAVDNNGVPTIIYTGVSPEVQCIATSDDDMITWKKHGKNPVIDSPPEDLEVTGFRDPCVWKEEDVWYMLIGSGIKGKGGTSLLYRSKDLIDWEYLHPPSISAIAGTLAICGNARNSFRWATNMFYLFQLGGTVETPISSENTLTISSSQRPRETSTLADTSMPPRVWSMAKGVAFFSDGYRRDAVRQANGPPVGVERSPYHEYSL